jgi:hypothetical protein
MTRYARIRPLTAQRGEDIGETFRRLGDSLRGSDLFGTLKCTILGAEETRHWVLEFQDGDCALGRDAANIPDLEIITPEATWLEIAGGHLSPLDAFTQGRFRIRGDTQLGSKLLRHLREGGGAVSVCGE